MEADKYVGMFAGEVGVVDKDVDVDEGVDDGSSVIDQESVVVVIGIEAGTDVIVVVVEVSEESCDFELGRSLSL
jgi:hypothetical protein